MQLFSEREELNTVILETVNSRKPENSEQLQTFVSNQVEGASLEEIKRAISKLEDQGKITFAIPQTLGRYLKSRQTGWYWIILAVGAATVACFFLVPVDLAPFSYIRNVLGLVFVFGLPGFAFVKAVLPDQFSKKQPTDSLISIERAALSVGISIALAPMVGLVLYYTPVGLDMPFIVVCLFGLTVALATAALIRDSRKAIHTPSLK
jgi:hypothetical protein